MTFAGPLGAPAKQLGKQRLKLELETTSTLGLVRMETITLMQGIAYESQRIA